MSPDPAPVNERAATLVNELIRDASSDGADHLAERLRIEASRWRAKETVVVLGGEPNRGKSSLLNAMLGEQVVARGATTATTTHLLVRHGADRHVVVHREGQEPASVPFDQVARWATASSADQVDSVVIEMDNPLLATGLVLVDTPGVGGLDGAHGRITLIALARADAMVFLLDPAEPLSKSELDFLTEATERLELVVFVVARTDRYPGWRQVADDHEQLIAAHAPRFAGAPIVGTSARLAVEASGPDATDDDLRDASGIPVLVDTVLRRIVGRVAAVRLANLLRLGDTVLSALEAPHLVARQAAAGEVEARGVVEREQAAVDAFRDASERLGIETTDRFNALREQAQTEFNRLVRELTAKFDASGTSSRSPEDLLEEVRSEVRAGCAELGERLDREVEQIHADIEAVVGDLGVEVPSLVLGDGALAEGVAAAGTDAEAADPMARLRIASAVTSGGTGLAMFGRFAAGGDVVLATMMGAGAIMAVTLAAINVKLGRRQRDTAGLRKQVVAALDAARGEATPVVRQQILAVQRTLELAMRTSVRQQLKDGQARVTEATNLMRADEAQRQRSLAAAEQKLSAYSARRATVEGLIAEVSAILRAQPG